MTCSPVFDLGVRVGLQQLLTPRPDLAKRLRGDGVDGAAQQAEVAVHVVGQHVLITHVAESVSNKYC